MLRQGPAAVMGFDRRRAVTRGGDVGTSRSLWDVMRLPRSWRGRR
jgi:hypothetical protein